MISMVGSFVVSHNLTVLSLDAEATSFPSGDITGMTFQNSTLLSC